MRKKEQIAKLRIKKMELVSENCELTSKVSQLEDYIKDLEKKIDKIKCCYAEEPKLKPALTPFCSGCKFAYIDPYGGQLIGCMKEVVCDDFQKEE